MVTRREQTKPARTHPKPEHQVTLSNGNFTLVSAMLNPCYGLSSQAFARFWVRVAARRAPAARVLALRGGFSSGCRSGNGTDAASSRIGFPTSLSEGLLGGVGWPTLR